MARPVATNTVTTLSVVLWIVSVYVAINAAQGPTYKLHVLAQSNLGLRVQTDTPGGAVASFGGYGNFEIDAPGVVGGRLLVSGDGRVGVGTTNPLAKLDLLGGADANGATDPRALAIQWHGGGYRHWLRTRHNSLLGDSNAIDFFVNNSSGPDGSTGPGVGSLHVMTLDSGRVGIRTTSPTEALTVGGTIQSTSGGFKFPDGSVQASAATFVNDAYFTKAGDVNLQISGSSNAPVLHLNLPPGTYALTATVMIRNMANFFAQDNSRFFECNFSGDSNQYGGVLAQLEFQTYTYHSVLNISSGFVDLLCHVTTTGNPTSVFVRSSRFTAVKIGGIVTTQ